jgi:transcriptional regulator with XRE-family HTH domain
MYGGDLVREARRRAGVTQRQLAERGGTTQSAIARLETGQTNPSFDLVVRLIEACGFRLDVFLDPYDDSDLAQAQAVLREPDADTRIDSMEAAVAFAEELRAAYQAAVNA